MKSQSSASAAPLIVGAGPTGLSMAITLRRFGIPIRIIDRASEGSQMSKALAIWSGSLEAFDAMGVVQTFLARGTTLKSIAAGHGRRLLASIPVGTGVDSPHPHPILLPQSHTESILNQHLASLDASVERGVELVGLKQDEDAVEAALRYADGREEIVRTSYLLGCDGAHSVVRQSLGVEFEGYAEPQAFLLCDARIDGLEDWSSIHLWWHADGSIGLFPVQEGVWRVFAVRSEGDPHRAATLEEMQSHVDTHGPAGLRLRDPTWLSVFHIDERVAASFRAGRCFLAGDAAHIHSPAGGQGMNTGIQDAVNLGWKLAYALERRGDEGALLDSYQAERRPVALSVVKAAAQKLHIGLGQTVAGRVMRSIAVPVLAHFPRVQRKLEIELSETDTTYTEGALMAMGRTGTLARAWVGRRARDASINDMATGLRSRLWPLLCGTCHTLMLFSDEPATRDLTDLARRAGNQLKMVRIAPDEREDSASRRYDAPSGSWVLVRPDQVIAARGVIKGLSQLERYAKRVLERT